MYLCQVKDTSFREPQKTSWLVEYCYTGEHISRNFRNGRKTKESPLLVKAKETYSNDCPPSSIMCQPVIVRMSSLTDPVGTSWETHPLWESGYSLHILSNAADLSPCETITTGFSGDYSACFLKPALAWNFPSARDSHPSWREPCPKAHCFMNSPWMTPHKKNWVYEQKNFHRWSKRLSWRKLI